MKSHLSPSIVTKCKKRQANRCSLIEQKVKQTWAVLPLCFCFSLFSLPCRVQFWLQKRQASMHSCCLIVSLSTSYISNLSYVIILLLTVIPVSVYVQSYVVYLGRQSYASEPSATDLDRVTDAHHELLGSCMKR